MTIGWIFARFWFFWWVQNAQYISETWLSIYDIKTPVASYKRTEAWPNRAMIDKRPDSQISDCNISMNPKKSPAVLMYLLSIQWYFPYRLVKIKSFEHNYESSIFHIFWVFLSFSRIVRKLQEVNRCVKISADKSSYAERNLSWDSRLFQNFMIFSNPNDSTSFSPRHWLLCRIDSRIVH
jgi:hypothetical protein